MCSLLEKQRTRQVPSLKRLLRSGSSYDTLVYAVSELHGVCTKKPHEQLTEEESQEFDRAIATLRSTFTNNDFTAYELEQSNLEGLLEFVFNGDNSIGCTYIPYFSSAFGLSEESLILPDGKEEDEEDNMIEKRHRSGSKCGGIYGYQGGAFSKLINALQNSLAKDVEVSSSVGRMREKRDGALTSSRISSSSKRRMIVAQVRQPITCLSEALRCSYR